MIEDLWQWTATDLAAAIRTRKISSREALESCIARLDEVNPRINAVVDDLREDQWGYEILEDAKRKENKTPYCDGAGE